MKRLILICALLVLAMPAAALPGQAQDTETEAKIANALSALPAALARDAAVMDYPADGGTDWIELRPGSNGWTCFPDWPATPGNDPQCNDARWMKWMEAYIGGTDPDISTVGLAYMLQGGSDPSATDPSALEPAPGDDWITSPPHVMILSPTPLDASLFSADPNSGGPWLMFVGTPYEHIMMPVPPQQQLETDDPVAGALSAAPAAVARDAAVLDYPPDGETEFVELRAGSSDWTCYPDWQLTPGNDPMCVDPRWVEWVDALYAGTDPDISTLGLAYMLQGGSDASANDPFALQPAAGDDWIISPPHIMILSPVTLDPNLYSTDPNSGGPWLMFPNTPYAHIMMPVESAQTTGASTTPDVLPTTGAEVGFVPVGVLVLAGLGLVSGAWFISRRRGERSRR